MIKRLILIGLAIATTPAIAGKPFSLPLNKLPPLQVGETTFMTAVDYTSVDNASGVLVQVTGGYDISSQSFSRAPVAGWIYSVQLFKDGDEFPIDGVIQTVNVSDRAKCGCIKFSDTDKRVSTHGRGGRADHRSARV